MGISIRRVGIYLSALFLTIGCGILRTTNTYATCQAGDTGWGIIQGCVNDEPAWYISSTPIYIWKDNFVGSFGGVYGNTDGFRFNVVDETVAKFEHKESTFIDYEGNEQVHGYDVIHGLKSGKTALQLLDSDDAVVASQEIRVVTLESNIKGAQALGTSQTFTIAQDSDNLWLADIYIVQGTGSLQGNEEAVSITDNGSGSYTLTANAIPVYNDLEDGAMQANPLVVAAIFADENDVQAIACVWDVYLYEGTAYDAASDAADTEEVAEENEEILGNYSDELVSAVLSDLNLVDSSEPASVTLSDGTIAIVQDPKAFAEAVMGGEQIKVTLTEPESRDPEEIADVELDAMEEALEPGAEGRRYVRVEVEVSAGRLFVGNITDLSEPVAVMVDVSDDEEVEENYTRTYYTVGYHGGIASSRETVYSSADKTVAFYSNGFSDFLIAYKDTLITTDDPTEDEPTDDGETSTKETNTSTEESTVKAPNSGRVTTSLSASTTVVPSFILASILVLAGFSLRKH